MILTSNPIVHAGSNSQETIGVVPVNGSPPPPAGSASQPSSVVTISQQAYSLLQQQDITAPKVKTFSPRDGAGNVSLTANITVRFSETVQRGSGNIILSKASGEVVETFSASSNRVTVSGKTLMIDPTDSFEMGTRYYVTFESGTVVDLSGNANNDITTYDFMTKPDRTKPKVTSFFPTDGANSVSTSQSITVTFSEAIERGTGNVYLKDARGRIIETFDSGSAGIAINGRTLTIDPADKLATDSRYFVVFAAGSVKDLAGNKYGGSKNYDFMTASTDTPVEAPAGTIDNSTSPSAFNITVDYSGDQAYLTYFQQAKAIWENIISSDLPDVGNIDDLKIAASVAAIDGAGGILGQAGPTFLRGGSNLPYEGTMQFDSADVVSMASSGTLMRVILHEMGHVLGLGTLWSTFGFNSTAGQYTGTYALAAYKAISGGNPAATYIPLEDNGGGGTANVHWEEDVFGDELMTGYAEGDGNMPLSILTVTALKDLGYTVNENAAESYNVSA